MCRIESLFLLQRQKESMSGDAQFQQHRDMSYQLFFLQGKTPKEIHAILTETLVGHAPLYATIKN
jgi:hypothetical protein